MNAKTAQQRRAQLYALLGELPSRERPIKAEVVKRKIYEGYILETLDLELNGIERVPAYFARPKGECRQAPVILYNHAHGGDYELGKDELILGRAALQSPPYAEALTQQGYCVLSIDSWNFGERRGRTESALFKEMLWQGRVLWGMMVYDSIRAIDYLCTRPEIDPERIATIGLSMGSTMAWWLAALDPRISVCVDLCCLTDFEELIRTQGLDGHGIYYYVPSLLKHFSTSDIVALIAPRPHLSLAGNHDPLTPPAGLDKIDRDMRKAYGRHGRSECWELVRYETGHFETAHGRAQILDFLEQWL